MKHLNSKSAFPAILLPVLCYLFSVLSCQTAPKISDTVMNETGFVPLNTGASAYIFADIPHAMPILTNLALYEKSDKQLKQMIDKTRFAVAAAYSQPAVDTTSSHPLRYQLIAWGNYPASGAKMVLGASKGWKKHLSSISKARYWHSEQGGLSIAINPAQVYISAAALNALHIPVDPFTAAPGTAIPEDFNEFCREAILSCWIDKPSAVINQKLGEAGIPLEFPAEQIFVSLFPAPNQPESNDEHYYEARLRIEVSSAAQARALVSVFAIARGFLSLNMNPSETSSGTFAAIAAIFFANPPVQEDKYLTIKTNALNAGEIALLLNIFSL